MYFLGVDGGGTRTTCVVADLYGNITARACGNSINYNSVGFIAARSNMRAIMKEIYAQMGTHCMFKCAFIGMSAISERASQEETEAFATGVIDAAVVIMDSDVYIALAAMGTGFECAAAISGTGSMVAGRNSQSAVIHTGGWGYILGDEGSGYKIALDALQAAVRSHEGSCEPTALKEELYDFCGSDDMDGIIEAFYNPPMERSAIAAFTPRVFKCADKGDGVALDIITANAAALAQTSFALLKDLPLCKAFGLWGGVFQHNELYRRIFTELLHKQYPHIQAELLSRPPEHGAVFAAIEEYKKRTEV